MTIKLMNKIDNNKTLKDLCKYSDYMFDQMLQSSKIWIMAKKNCPVIKLLHDFEKSSEL